jgi:hypothetical protein
MTLEEMLAIAKVGEGRQKNDILVKISPTIRNFNMRKIMVLLNLIYLKKINDLEFNLN